MNPDTWTAISAIASVAAAIGTCLTVFAVYHVRRLDTQFHVKCEVQASERDSVLCIHLMREKFGGPSGKITGIRLNKSSGFQISAKRPLTVRNDTDTGWSWAPPAFGNEAGADVSFSAHDREVFVDFWVRSDRQAQLIAILLLDYNRPIFRTKKIKIYVESIK